VIAGAGWAIVAAAALELCAREVARRRVLPAALGGDWSNVALALTATVAGTLVFAIAPRTRRGRFRTLLLFAVLFTAGVAAQLQLGARLQSDGFYYYAYLRSLAFDGDVEFTNDYRLLGLGDKAHLFQLTSTGHAQSAWTIGPALVWSPFAAAGHLVARRLHESDPNVSVDGVSYPYRQAICIAGLVYGLLGSWFIFRLVRLQAGVRLAAAATVMTVAGSFMLWYLVKEPSMTHAPSMALVAGFAWAWWATRQSRTRTVWVLLGLLAGLMTLVRWQNALFALLPACDSARQLAGAWRNGDRQAARDTIVNGLLFTTAAVVAFTPQMLAWRAIYGSWLAVSPVGPQIRFGDPHLVDILWSSRNGLFSTSPVLYLGAAGLLLFAWRHPAAGLPCLLAVAAMTYFNACIQDWWGSAGYGGRRFDGTVPLFAIGVACATGAAVALLRRHPAAAVAAAGTALILWNLTQMSLAQAGILRIGEAVSFGDTMAGQARVFHRWFGNPFTYPVSLVYGLRNRVAPGRYDLLSANRFLGDPLQPYGRIDIGSADEELLAGGWYQAEREGTTTFRWGTSPASVLVPLDHPAALRVQVRLHAFAFPGAPEQQLVLAVNGRAQPGVPVEGGWHVTEVVVGEDAWRGGVNRLELRFAWSRAPMDAGLGNDPRSLAAAVDYIRVAVAR
jgi:hypothetical protein